MICPAGFERGQPADFAPETGRMEVLRGLYGAVYPGGDQDAEEQAQHNRDALFRLQRAAETGGIRAGVDCARSGGMVPVSAGHVPSAERRWPVSACAFRCCSPSRTEPCARCGGWANSPRSSGTPSCRWNSLCHQFSAKPGPICGTPPWGRARLCGCCSTGTCWACRNIFFDSVLWESLPPEILFGR